jgi:transcriptional regulator with XRE-family HTH domain
LSVGELVRRARERAPGAPGAESVSIRELARRAGISAAQLSRIESGHVENPSPATLARIAAAVGRDARPLWVAAGHIRGQDAVAVLEQACEIEVEIFEGSTGDENRAQQARAMLVAIREADADLVRLAGEIFQTYTSPDTTWWNEYVQPALDAPEGNPLKELIRAYQTLPPNRFDKIVEYVRDQLRLFELESKSDRS